MVNEISEFLDQLSAAQSEEERSWIIIENFLKSLPFELSLATLSVSIPHWFDAKILAALLPELESSAEQLYHELQNLPFIEVFPGRGHNLHESSRRLIATRLWSENPDQFYQFSVNMAIYFASHHNQVEFQIEWLYHLIIANPSDWEKNLLEVVKVWINEFRTDALSFLMNRLLERVNLIHDVVSTNTNLKNSLEENLDKIFEELFTIVTLIDGSRISVEKSSKDTIKSRNMVEAIWRRVLLFQPSSTHDFNSSIIWIAKLGGREELSLLQKIANEPPYSSRSTTILLGIAIQKIEKGLDLNLKKNKKEVDSEINFTRDSVLKLFEPIHEGFKEKLIQLGVKILQPLGKLELVISMPGIDISELIRGFEEVAQVTPYVPRILINLQYIQKLDKEVRIRDLTGNETTDNFLPESFQNYYMQFPQVLIASFFTLEDRDNAIHNLKVQGIKISNVDSDSKLTLDIGSHQLIVDHLKVILSQVGLKSLEEFTIPTCFNDKAVQLIGKNVVPSNSLCTLSLTGRGEIIAIADTGLDTGEIDTIHLDFRGRVITIISYPIPAYLYHRISAFDDDNKGSDKNSGHGTHLAGCSLGNGKQAEELGLSSKPAGIAPEALLVFQAMEKNIQWNDPLNRQEHTSYTSGLFGMPDDLSSLFHDAYKYGARIHSNSWGRKYGVYDSACYDLDSFVRENKDFLVIFSAGSSAKQSFSNKKSIELGSVTAPGTAKNCLTVGATENNRSDQFPDTYGTNFPTNFPFDPFKTDGMVDSIDDIAAFSGRGPCNDGRIKPDVVAPGTFILSTRSSLLPNDGFTGVSYPPAKQYYMYMSGTSTATALVAGCAALVRQFLCENHRPSIHNPSAALVKAIIIHSAVYINYRFAHPTSRPWADNEQGWGRVSLQEVLNPPAPKKVVFIDQRLGLATGDKDIYTVKIMDKSVPLKAHLVYTDFPGDRLVNNLNLILYSRSGKYYRGNDFEGTLEADSMNNVEGVIIQSPEEDTWEVHVVAAEVMINITNCEISDTQDYALVISGGGLEIISHKRIEQEEQDA